MSERVQEARRDAALACADLQVADAYVPASDFYPALDALIAAVRAERVESVPLPTSDEAWDLYRGIKRIYPDEQDAIVAYTRTILAALEAR